MPAEALDNDVTAYEDADISDEECAILYNAVLNMRTGLDMLFKVTALPYTDEGIYYDAAWLHGVNKDKLPELKEMCSRLLDE